jgi:anti-sigma regulatory factor (Ser/Thr protein kinase)
MSVESEDMPPTRLTLQYRLEDLTLVAPWIERLGERHNLPEQTQFSINLCLEEALSNVIRHGHDIDPNHTITVDFEMDGKGHLALVVEDRAEPFDPVVASAAKVNAAPATEDDLQPGGRGLRFLRAFSSALAYERLRDGNRLTIGFALPA